MLMALLPEIADLADRLSERLPADTGGERPLFALFHGSPKQVLAVQCWELFWYFRPGEATGGEGSKYYKFTAWVYELATDEEADEKKGVGLRRYTDKAVKECDDLVSRVPGLRDHCHLLAAEGSPVGFISNSSLAAHLLGVPNRLIQELGSVRRRKE